MLIHFVYLFDDLRPLQAYVSFGSYEKKSINVETHVAIPRFLPDIFFIDIVTF